MILEKKKKKKKIFPIDLYFLCLQYDVQTKANGPDHAKMCLMPYANNNGTVQTVRMRSLISTFVVRWLGSMICILALSKVSRF